MPLILNLNLSKHRNGFTAIEFVGILSIVVMLAAMPEPSLRQSVVRRQRISGLTHLSDIKDAFMAACNRNHTLPDNSSWSDFVACFVAVGL